MDTLREISNSLNNDPSFSNTMITLISSKANQVDLSNAINLISSKANTTDLSNTNTIISNLSANLANNYYTKTNIDTTINLINSSLSNLNTYAVLKNNNGFVGIGTQNPVNILHMLLETALLMVL